MNKQYNGLPLYIMSVDEAEGMTAIAITDSPAIQVDWLTFNKQEEKLKFKVYDDGMEHKVLTCICRADFPIYRIGNSGYEYYVMFTKETIEKMVQKYLKGGYQTEINIEHQEDAFIQGFEVEQLFIKNTEKGINPAGFESIEEGSLFGVFKIEDEELWKYIQEGYFTSVSLEGMFNLLEPEEDNPVVEEREFDTIEDLLKWLQD